MATPTVQNVKDGARGLLGDDEVAGGQVFTDAVLGPFFASAYRRLYRVLKEHSLPLTELITHFRLQPHARIVPLSLIHSSFGEIITLRSASIASSAAITAAVYDSSNVWVTVTATAHGFSDGDRVVVLGVAGLSSDVNDEWGIDVVDTDTFRLAGANPSGTYTTGGTAYRINGWSDPWVEAADPADLDLTPPPTSADQPLRARGQLFSLQNKRLYFSPSTDARLLRLEHNVSGVPPTTDTDPTGVDDSLDYLQYMTAALAASPRMPSVARECRLEAEGPSPDVEFGGILGTMLNNGIKAMQSRPITTQRFRPRRNTGLHRAF